MTSPLPISAPSIEGVDARALVSLISALERVPGYEPHSIALARHGRAIVRGWWAPYSADRIHLVYSISKTFTATAVGMLVDQGLLSLSDRVFELLDLDREQLDPAWLSLTLGDCLRMATGHLDEAWTWGRQEFPPEGGQPDSRDGLPLDPVLVRIFQHPPERPPGTVFAYNQVATYLVGACIRAVTSGDMLDVIRPRFVEPLRIGPVMSQVTPGGRQLCFSGVHARTDALLALAQLYLGEGAIHGRRFVSAQWVRTARTPTDLFNHAADGPDWAKGYGCSLWSARHGYRGDGAYGQFAIVLPEQDIALALTGEGENMQAVLDVLWEHLLPAVGRAGSAEADAELAQRLAGLGHDPWGSHGAPRSSGSWALDAPAILPGVDRLTVEQHDQGYAVDVGGRFQLAVGDGSWIESEPVIDGWRLPIVASGGWDASGSWHAILRLIETPHSLRVTASPDGLADLRWRIEPLSGPQLTSAAVHRLDA